MIKVKFSVRAGQGEPSGFDLGDILVEGEHGAANSGGHVPDQGMMIYPSVTLLLDSLRMLFSEEKKQISFTGVDTSFRLDFKCARKGLVSVSESGTLLGKSSLDDLSNAVLRSAQILADEELSGLAATDPVQNDFRAALRDLRATVTRKQ